VNVERVHLDLVGGIAGDMFAAALASAFPEHVPELLAEVRKLPAEPGARVHFLGHESHGIRGQRFLAESPAHGGHVHATHREIRAQLSAAGLQREVCAHAIELFARLAHAEAEVHGVSADDVVFHEVGAWDSIVDFVAAAYFTAKLSPARWSWTPAPLGSGRVRTAHGVMPVPAPATVLLLKGLPVVDDGVAGERVTPTGAAILRYLADISAEPGPAYRRPEAIAAVGHGFGTRSLDGIPNMLRCVAFTPAAASVHANEEEIATLHFEIDDQTAEDLALALDRIREAPGVLDATQTAVVGKKGRLGTQVQVLARADAVDEVAALCLSQTTTLGLRIAAVRRLTLPRSIVEAEGTRVKLARRPGGELTAKAENADMAAIPGDRASRENARERSERSALEAARRHDDGHDERD